MDIEDAIAHAVHDLDLPKCFRGPESTAPVYGPFVISVKRRIH